MRRNERGAAMIEYAVVTVILVAAFAAAMAMLNVGIQKRTSQGITVVADTMAPCRFNDSHTTILTDEECL